MKSFRPPINRRRQSGVVLLTVMLVIIAAGAYVLLQALNVAAANSQYNAAATRAALMEAKMALIGYAVSFPERSTNPNAGPGRLPCPDFNFFGGGADPVLGSSDSCSLGANTETGLFPWYTIDTNELRDGSGSRLWYAVSDVHRSNAAGVVNSDTRDATTPIQVDGSTEDIVAVIIAPGQALGSQDRSASIVEIYDPTNYLEGQNASTGDNIFTAIGAGAFNDELVVITRGELMAAVEQRVLRDVETALNRYHADPDDNPSTTGDEAYPWLRTFGDPDTIDIPTPGSESATLSNSGQLSIHQLGVDYDANFRFSWNISSVVGTASNAGPGPDYPDVTCVRSLSTASSCWDGVHGRIGPTEITGLPSTEWQQGVCTWNGFTELDCTAIETFTSPGTGDVIERTYTVEVTGITPDMVSPTTITDRERRFSFSGALPTDATITITLSDVIDPAGVATDVGSTTVALTAGDSVVDVTLDNIPLYITPYDHTDPLADKPPGALPQWFTVNQWHRMLLLAYANAERPGDTATACVAGTDCLNVEWNRLGGAPMTALNDVTGVIVIGGADLDTLTTRPSTARDEYFEDENVSVDTTYVKGPLTSLFNDRVSILDPNAP